MKGRVLAAGWPFAGLLALDAGRPEVRDAAPVTGRIVDHDPQRGILVLESHHGPGAVVTDATTRFYGVDGYPIERRDIRVGDTIEAVQDNPGAEGVAMKVRVLRLAPRTSAGNP